MNLHRAHDRARRFPQLSQCLRCSMDTGARSHREALRSVISLGQAENVNNETPAATTEQQSHRPLQLQIRRGSTTADPNKHVWPYRAAVADPGGIYSGRSPQVHSRSY